MELRLLLAQGVQGVAGVIAPLLAERVFFRDVQQRLSLIDVQWTYLAIALFDVILALFFYYMPLPEAADADLEEYSLKAPLTDSSPNPVSNFFGKYSVIITTLAAGVAAQFLYVSAQESISTYVPIFLNFATSENSISSRNLVLIGKTLFAFGRFLFAGLTLIVAPRILLLVAFLGSLVFTIVEAVVPVPGNLNTIAAASLLVFFFEGPIFPLIVSNISIYPIPN